MASALRPYLYAFAFTLSVPALAQDMNAFVVKAVESISKDRAGLGYDINAAFTRDLAYQGNCCIPASPRAPKTMCVAAVTEVMIEALNLYHKTTGNNVLDRLPTTAFTRSNRLSLRPYLFQHVETDVNGVKKPMSRGLGHAMELFGIGDQLAFQQLKPGDFLTFNRSTSPPSGHAVVFLGFINRRGRLERQHGDAVVGFRYFSAQGTETRGGFGFRNAFFGNFCPPALDGVTTDCKVIKSSDLRLLNGGRMTRPDGWKVAEAQARIKKAAEARVELVRGKTRDEAFRRLVDGLLSEELDPGDLSHMNAQ